MGQCTSCRKQRLIDPDTKMCLPCENDHLKERVSALELQLNACIKERGELIRSKAR
ncbi:MAG: hypothetical protein U0M13_04895 [Desulfovibrio fairfieldensis]|nr:hypothetical protein [Desulfovibrio fairfieldensis]